MNDREQQHILTSKQLNHQHFSLKTKNNKSFIRINSNSFSLKSTDHGSSSVKRILRTTSGRQTHTTGTRSKEKKTVDLFEVIMNSPQQAALPWIPALWSSNPTVFIHFWSFASVLFCNVSCYTWDQLPPAGQPLHGTFLILHVCYSFHSVYECKYSTYTHPISSEITHFLQEDTPI